MRLLSLLSSLLLWIHLVNAIPEPTFYLSTWSSDIMLKEDVDVVLSTNNLSAGTYYFMVLKDGDVVHTGSFVAPNSPISHTINFNKEGKHTIAVALSDQLSNDQNKLPLERMVTSEGLMPSFRTVQVNVLPKLACYSLSINPNRSDSVTTLDVSVNSLRGLETEDIIQTFHDNGDYLDVILRNGTHALTYTSTFDHRKGRWHIEIPGLDLRNNTIYNMEISTHYGSAVNGCGIHPFSQLLSTSFLIDTSLGLDYRTSTTQVKALYDSGFSSTEPRTISDLCIRTTQMLLLPPQTGTAHREVFAFTTDDWSSYTIYSLTGDSNNGVCKDLTTAECDSLAILDASIIGSHIFILTNHGLIYNYAMEETTSSKRVLWQKLELDEVKVTPNARLFGDIDCVSLSASVLYISTKESISADVMLYIEERESETFEESITPIRMGQISGFTGLTNEDVMIEVFFSTTYSDFVFLAGRQIGDDSCQSQNTCRYNNARIYSYRDGRIVKELPLDPTEEVTSMAMHRNGHDLFVYGHKLYTTIDFGETLTLIHELPENHVFYEFTSGTTLQDYALKTSENEIFYGRIGSNLVVSLGEWDEGDLMSIHFDRQDSLVATVFDLKPRTTLPQGIFANADGRIRDSDLPFIYKEMLPYASMVNFIDSVKRTVLAPMNENTANVLFYAWDEVDKTTPVFSSRHVGLTMMHRVDSSIGAYVKEVSASGRVLGAEVNSKYLSKLCKAPTGTLTLSFSEAVIDRSKHAPSIFLEPTLEPVTLEVDGGYVWSVHDVHKTVVTTSSLSTEVDYFQGSFVITAMPTGTSVAAQAVAYALDKDADASTEFSTGRWMICDFDAVAAGEASVDTVEVTQEGDIFVVAVPDEDMPATFENNIVIEFSNSQWGFVLGRRDDDLIVADGQGMAAGSYDADAVLFYEVEGSQMAQPSVGMRTSLAKPWHLLSSACRWSAIETSLSQETYYIDYLRNVSFTSIVNMQAYHTLQTKMLTLSSNSSSLEMRVAPFADDSKAKVTIHMKDVGRQGFMKLSVRPTDVSLLCPPSVITKHIMTACPDTYNLEVEHEELGWVTLPANYRPPSFAGRRVPLSENIYNARPELPMYENWDKRSQATGIYKQCLGKTNSSQCGCDSEWAREEEAHLSDCIREAKWVYFADTLHLKYKAMSYGQEPVYIRQNVTLRELNNRTDYCISSMSNCLDKKGLYTHRMGPDDGIKWESSGLFHFEVAVNDTDYCAGRTQFIVYVPEANPITFQATAAMLVTAYVFFLWLTTVYIWHSYKSSITW